MGDYFEKALKVSKGVKFEYYEEIGKFQLKLSDGDISHINLSPQAGYVLGYEEGKEIKNYEMAKYSPDLRGGVSQLCVYINNNVIENMIVGDRLASLLQIIAVSGGPGEVIEQKYDSPLFSRVVAKELQEIEIELRTLEGRLVPFDYGTTIVTLQFKKAIVF